MVSYDCQALDAALATAPVLILERYPGSGAVEGETAWYRFLGGQDRFDHRQNRLASVTKELYYRSGRLWALKVLVDVSVPEIAPGPYLNGRVTAEIFYTNVSSGTFTGTVDRATGKMQGVYSENGVGHKVTYHRSQDFLEWDEAPVEDDGK